MVFHSKAGLVRKARYVAFVFIHDEAIEAVKINTTINRPRTPNITTYVFSLQYRVYLARVL